MRRLALLCLLTPGSGCLLLRLVRCRLTLFWRALFLLTLLLLALLLLALNRLLLPRCVLLWLTLLRLARLCLTLLGFALLRFALFRLALLWPLGRPRLLGGKFRGSLRGVLRIVGRLRGAGAGGPIGVGRPRSASGVIGAGRILGTGGSRSSGSARGPGRAGSAGGACGKFLRFGGWLLRFLWFLGRGRFYLLVWLCSGFLLGRIILLVLGRAFGGSGFGGLCTLVSGRLFVLRRGVTYLAGLASEPTGGIRGLCVRGFSAILCIRGGRLVFRARLVIIAGMWIRPGRDTGIRRGSPSGGITCRPI